MRLLLLAALTLSTTAGAEPTRLHRPSTPPPTPPPLFPPEKRIFFGFSAGSGTGIIGGRTEALAADVDTGFQWAPLHFRAELVALRNPRWGFGISARLGFPVGADTDPPAAKAVMLKGYHLCPTGLRYSAGIGAGYIRYRTGVDGMTTDTMASGPLLIGGGAGYLVPISKSWRLTIDANVTAGIAVTGKYAGVPNEHALHFDLDVGLAIFR